MTTRGRPLTEEARQLELAIDVRVQLMDAKEALKLAYRLLGEAEVNQAKLTARIESAELDRGAVAA